MNNYYVIGITNYNDGTKDTYSVTKYDDIKSAKKIYHQKLQTIYSSTNISLGLVQIIDSYGVNIISEYYEEKIEQNN